MNGRAPFIIVAAVVSLIVAAASPAQAHPLGNFTVNRYAGIEIGLEEITVHYAIDMAEIPAFQEMDAIDSNRDGSASDAELDAYARALRVRLRDRLRLEIDGAAADLALSDASAALRDGQGGLDVLRVDLAFVAPISNAKASIEFADSNYSNRVGWREVVAYGVGGQGIAESSVPSASVSNELRSYPKDLLSSPLRVAGASIEADPSAPGRVRSEPNSSDGTVSSLGRIGESLSTLLDRKLSPALVATAMLLALVAGALHALGPGHGKTIMAAYLVGAGGRARHALTVGVAVSLMHTASVVALGLVTLWASSLFPPESVFPWLSLASGTIVLSLGVWLLQQRVRTRGSSHVHHHHSHGHEGHSHHGLGDDGRAGQSHDHQPQGSPLSWKGLGAIAVSGGLLPSPTAVVVLLGAVALHRVPLGVAMVSAFSIGLAGALTAVGILVLKARDLASRRFGGRMTATLGVASATAISLLGAVLTAKAVISL